MLELTGSGKLDRDSDNLGPAEVQVDHKLSRGIEESGGPSEVRTRDLMLRRHTLYPSELPAHFIAENLAPVLPGTQATAAPNLFNDTRDLLAFPAFNALQPLERFLMS